MKLLIGFLSLFLFASTASAQKVAVGYDHAVDFSTVRTYSWEKGVPAKNPELDRRIISSIERELTERGLQRVDANADAIVSYHAAVIPDFDQATVARPGTWGARAGSMGQVWEVTRGSLIVQIVNGKSKQELWRASATETVQEQNLDVSKNLDKASKKIDKVVEKMFKHYPTTKGGKKS